MKTLALALALALVAPLFASDEPDLDPIIVLHGRFGSAHACPIDAKRAITAAHVLDPEPFDPAVGLVSHRFAALGIEGFAFGERTSGISDLGTVILSDPLPRWYSIAARLELDEELWWLGFDFTKKSKAYQRKVFHGRVVTNEAGLIVVDTDTVPGSSGSCVVNAAGQVVGVVAYRRSLDNTDMITGIMSVQGRWFELVEKDPSVQPRQ